MVPQRSRRMLLVRPPLVRPLLVRPPLGVLVLCCALAGCERAPVDNVYYPLDAGRRWTYTLVALAPAAAPTAVTITGHGEEELGGRRVSRQRIDVGGESHYLFIGVDDRGVYRYATQSAGEAEPAIDATRDYYLTYPVAVGRSWKSESEPSFVDARVRVPIESRIESTTDTVVVPAGEFRDCVKVTTSGTAPLPASGDAPPRSFSVREEVWYAKDVGMVRSVVVETIDGAEGQRVEVKTELAEAGR